MFIFNVLLIAMSVLALVVFVVLYFVEAGYGMLTSPKWGCTINNRLGWILMESPVFLAMLLLWWFSDRRFDPTTLIIFLLFQSHYIQRSFIFPFLIKGKSRMPVSIIMMGVTFNLLNAIMQGGWLFYLSPADRYGVEWLHSPYFMVGVVIFVFGMYTNIKSDSIIRGLRHDGDSGHYLPRGGMFNYVTSANYFGELCQWIGFAVLTWSWAGAVFAWWTFANLVPRAAAINKRYRKMFPEQLRERNLKRIIPFIY